MKLGIILVFVLVGTLVNSLAFAEEGFEFGVRSLPSKLVEDKEGLIHVFAKKGGEAFPEKITGLTVTSLDSSILRVINVKDSDSGFVSEVKVSSIDPGDTKLFLAAPGFSPTEIPITVYANKLQQEQLLVKATPDVFSTNGPNRGVVSVELADADGFPIVASQDIPIKLTLSNAIADIFQKEIVIKKGEYYAGTQFTVHGSGRTTIYASGEGLEGKSNEIKIGEEENNQTVSLFVFPEEINIQSRTVGHIIAILHENDGDDDNVNDCDFDPENNDECPITLAKKDIKVTYKVTNSIFDEGNISNDADIGESTGVFTIKKGSYWGHATFEVLGGKNMVGTYDVTISTGDPLALQKKQVNAVYDEFNNDGVTPKKQEGDKFVKLDVLPIFATGNEELIGVLHLVDKEGYPILAEHNLEIKIDSTDKNFVSVEPIILAAGSGSSLVFGNVGISIPEGDDNLQLNAAAEVGDNNPQLIETVMYGPNQETIKLEAESLIPKILSKTEFPIVVYLKDEKGITKFPNSANLFVSPSSIFEVEQTQISRGDDLVMLDSSAVGKGSEKIQFTYEKHETEVTLESLFVKPADIFIDHSEILFPGTNDVFSIQLLNSQKFPVFATEDVSINLVVKDESLVQVPQGVTIKKGDYFTLFDVAPKKSGTTEISALTEDLPLSSTQIEIKDLTPIVEIDAPDIVEFGEAFVATITATQDEKPLKDLAVTWKIEGGAVQLSDKKTGVTGEALSSIIPTSEQKVDVEASVSGSFYNPVKVSKIIRINATSEFVAFADDEKEVQFEKFEIAGIDPVIIIIPIAIGVVGFMLIKQGALRTKKTQVNTAPVN